MPIYREPLNLGNIKDLHVFDLCSSRGRKKKPVLSTTACITVGTRNISSINDELKEKFLQNGQIFGGFFIRTANGPYDYCYKMWTKRFLPFAPLNAMEPIENEYSDIIVIDRNEHYYGIACGGNLACCTVNVFISAGINPLEIILPMVGLKGTFRKLGVKRVPQIPYAAYDVTNIIFADKLQIISKIHNLPVITEEEVLSVPKKNPSALQVKDVFINDTTEIRSKTNDDHDIYTDLMESMEYDHLEENTQLSHYSERSNVLSNILANISAHSSKSDEGKQVSEVSTEDVTSLGNETPSSVNTNSQYDLFSPQTFTEWITGTVEMQEGNENPNIEFNTNDANLNLQPKDYLKLTTDSINTPEKYSNGKENNPAVYLNGRIYDIDNDINLQSISLGQTSGVEGDNSDVAGELIYNEGVHNNSILNQDVLADYTVESNVQLPYSDKPSVCDIGQASHNLSSEKEYNNYSVNHLFNVTNTNAVISDMNNPLNGPLNGINSALENNFDIFSYSQVNNSTHGTCAEQALFRSNFGYIPEVELLRDCSNEEKFEVSTGVMDLQSESDQNTRKIEIEESANISLLEAESLNNSSATIPVLTDDSGIELAQSRSLNDSSISDINQNQLVTPPESPSGLQISSELSDSSIANDSTAPVTASETPSKSD